MKTFIGLVLVSLLALSSQSARADAVCGLVDRIETVYTPEKTIPADLSHLDQGSTPEPTVIPASESIKITLNHFERFTFSPKDLKLSLAEIAYVSHTQFCIDQKTNQAWVLRQ
jgi:hypothetical protein